MRLAIAAAAVLLPLGCAAPEPARDPASERQARELLERAIEAQGGRAAIEAIESLREVARVNYRGNDLRITTWLGRPDKLRQIIIRGDTEQHSILDGDRAWAVIKSRGKEPVVTEMLPAGVDRLRELRKNWVPVLGAEAEVLRYPAVDARLHHVPNETITATDRRGRVRTLTINTDTGLLSAIYAGSGDEQVVYAYSDYRLVQSLGGAAIRWPHRIEISVGGKVTKQIRTVTIELDPELPPNAFRP